jgi:5-methyltetrahydropteroyltriglutamate--homocysteine methyltransferase
MLRADRRIAVTHVGSLVRPPALIDYLEKIRGHKVYDSAGFELCLKQSVAEVVRLQAEAGIDVVSDGEYGKSVTWAFYVHKRLSGIEWRSFTDEERHDPMATVISGRDREAFPEFYQEYDERVLGNARAVQRPVVTGPISYTGQPELRRDIETLKSAIANVQGTVGFLPVVVPASAIPNALAPLSTPGSICRSTTPGCRLCMRKWCRL